MASLMFVDSVRYPCFLLCNNFKEFIVKEKSAALYLYLPAATKVAKVMFLQVFVCQQEGGGVRGCWGHAWLLGGVCVVAGGHVWLLGVCGCQGGMRGKGGHAWQRGVRSEGGMRGIRRDTEIRSMSGRYASYWNAFLLMLKY